MTSGDLESARPGAEPYEGALQEGAEQLPWADVREELRAFIIPRVRWDAPKGPY